MKMMVKSCLKNLFKMKKKFYKVRKKKKVIFRKNKKKKIIQRKKNNKWIPFYKWSVIFLHDNNNNSSNHLIRLKTKISNNYKVVSLHLTKVNSNLCK